MFNLDDLFNFDLQFSMDQILLIYMILFICIIFVLLVKIMKKAGKRKIEALFPDLTFKDMMMKKEGIQLTYGKKKDKETVNFSPNQIFTEQKPAWKFWRSPRRKIYVNMGDNTAIGYKKGIADKKLIGELQYHWTKQEIKEWIRKQEAQAKAHAKLFSKTELIILIAMICLNFLVTIMIAREIGAI